MVRLQRLEVPKQTGCKLERQFSNLCSFIRGNVCRRHKVTRCHISTDTRIIFQMPSSKLLDLNYSPTVFCKKKKKKRQNKDLKRLFSSNYSTLQVIESNICEGLSALNPSFIQQIFIRHLLEVRNSVMSK